MSCMISRAFVILFLIRMVRAGEPWISAERNCSNFGSSVGILEWRVWREKDDLMARCDLHRVTSRLTFQIAWTHGNDLKKETLQLCESIPNKPLYCVYKKRNLYKRKNKKLSNSFKSEKGIASSIVCWVKSYDDWSLDNKTWCSSEQIELNPERTWGFDADAVGIQTTSSRNFSSAAVETEEPEQRQDVQPVLKSTGSRGNREDTLPYDVYPPTADGFKFNGMQCVCLAFGCFIFVLLPFCFYGAYRQVKAMKHVKMIECHCEKPKLRQNSYRSKKKSTKKVQFI